jgi:hypothetical protein
MTAPAHLPVVKAQQPEAQSPSEPHAPVMNWVPGALPEPPAGAAGGAGAAGAREEDRKQVKFEIRRDSVLGLLTSRGGCASTSLALTGLGVVYTRCGDGAAELDGCDIVGRDVAKAASTVALLSDDGTGALASGEGTATRCTVDISLAYTSDELLARSLTREDGSSRHKSNC